MITISDEIKLRAELAAQFYTVYLTTDNMTFTGYRGNECQACVDNANRIVDKAIKESLRV